jgi:hypothetical protein
VKGPEGTPSKVPADYLGADSGRLADSVGRIGPSDTGRQSELTAGLSEIKTGGVCCLLGRWRRMDDSFKQLYQPASDMDLEAGALQSVFFVCWCGYETSGGKPKLTT